MYCETQEVPDVPAELVTVTSTNPAAWGGTVASIVVGETTVKAEAAVPPKETAVTEVRFLTLCIPLCRPVVIDNSGKSLLAQPHDHISDATI